MKLALQWPRSLEAKFVEFSRDLCHGSHEGRVVWEGSRDGSFRTGFLNS